MWKTNCGKPTISMYTTHFTQTEPLTGRKSIDKEKQLRKLYEDLNMTKANPQNKKDPLVKVLVAIAGNMYNVYSFFTMQFICTIFPLYFTLGFQTGL